MSRDFRWEDPPPRSYKKASSEYDEIAARLKEHPGEWALVFADRPTTYVNHIKKGKVKAFQPAGSFDATSRRNPTGNARIYARYLGEPDV